MAIWKQIKDVLAFSDEFQKTFLDILTIKMEEQNGRYTLEFKS